MLSFKKTRKVGTTLMDIIALLNQLGEEICKLQDNFFDNPEEFTSFEIGTVDLFTRTAADLISGTLNEIDELLRQSTYRKAHYNIQRQDTRTLITTAGDVSFNNTLYRNRDTGEYRYLLNGVVGIEGHERFSTAAEAKLLSEAVRTSYRRASKVLPSKSHITKTTVMNKAHGINDELPAHKPTQKKTVKYLYIDADEDHVAEQHGRYDKENNTSFMCRLAYVYEGKSDECRNRKRLVAIKYIGGLYEGTDGVRDFWKRVSDYITDNYDCSRLEKVYINGDGANWIKSGTDYIYNSVFSLDRFHLMKYINAAARQMLDEEESCKSELYRLLYRGDKQGFAEYTCAMLQSAENSKAIEDLRKYVLNNWKAAMRTYHDKNHVSCSAEGHVSHILSDRLSSRPMGWSKVGADKMSRIRCYVENNGEEKLIELVEYSRKQRMLKKTGTDCAEVPERIMIHRASQPPRNQSMIYAERLQASIAGLTAKKALAIRRRLSCI